MKLHWKLWAHFCNGWCRAEENYQAVRVCFAFHGAARHGIYGSRLVGKRIKIGVSFRGIHTFAHPGLIHTSGVVFVSKSLANGCAALEKMNSLYGDRLDSGESLHHENFFPFGEGRGNSEGAKGQGVSLSLSF